MRHYKCCSSSRMMCKINRSLEGRIGCILKSSREEKVYELVVKEGGRSGVKAAGANDGRIGLRIERGNELVGAASPVSLLVNYLSEQLQRSVVDKTNLTGKYDFVLKWAPTFGTSASTAATEADAPPTSDAIGRSIFTALREDLGLKLQPAKGSVEMLVIDHVEKPDPN